jgi:DNA-binding PadR family transcriptional regulator
MYAEIVILAMLRTKPQHGYEIKKNLERVFGGAVSLNNKVLYPALRRFEEMGAVQREVVRQEGKPDRHIYQLTDRGTEVLQALVRDFSPDIASSRPEFLVRVAFFDLLEPEARRDILETRADVVAKELAHIQELKLLTRDDGSNLYAWRVLLFHEQQAQYELDWIQALVQETERVKER